MRGLRSEIPSVSSANRVFGPEIRMTATPAGTDPDDKAKIVSNSVNFTRLYIIIIAKSF